MLSVVATPPLSKGILETAFGSDQRRFLVEGIGRLKGCRGQRGGECPEIGGVQRGRYDRPGGVVARIRPVALQVEPE
jgi:hypothetical protein